MKKYSLAENIKYYKNLPRKRVSVGALFFNNKKQLLVVKPNYKSNWLVVGGTVDAKESPYQAMKREIKEEIGLTIKKLQPICFEYKLRKNFQGEAVYILFYGGILTQKQINSIKLQKSELDDYKFVDIKDAKKVLRSTGGHKLSHCMKAIKNKTIFYMENGKLI